MASHGKTRHSKHKPTTNSAAADGIGILSRISNSPALYRSKKTACLARRLLRSTGKAAWIAGTTFLILVVPLVIEMDREQQINELQLQQASFLGSGGAVVVK